MQHEEVINSKQGLLLLTYAVVKLIQTSTALNLDQMYQRELRLLAHHRTQQTQLLNQLYEVILLRINALSDYDKFSPSASENNETEFIESSLGELLTEYLNLVDTGSLPKEPFILSIERLQKKLIPILQNKEAEPFNDIDQIKEAAISTYYPSTVKNKSLSEVKSEMNAMAENSVRPILYWSKKEPRKKTKQKNKKSNDSIQIRIGSKNYSRFL